VVHYAYRPVPELVRSLVEAPVITRLVHTIGRAWWAVIAGWVALTAGLVLFAPAFEDVATYDDTAFLPETSPSVAGNRLVESGWPDDDLSSTITVVLERPDGPLTEADHQVLADLVDWARSDDAPAVLGPVTSHLTDPDLADTFVAADEQAVFFLIGLEVPAYTPPANAAVGAVRAHVASTELPDGTDAFVTGAAAVAADENVAIQSTLARTTWLSLVLVAGILLWVFRSPIAPLVPLTTVAVAFLVSRSVVTLLAQLGMDVSALYETFAIVIVFGAGTDYCLFLLARYREELDGGVAARLGPPRRLRVGALSVTVGVMLAVLGSSAATTIVGFSAQGVAEFGLYRTMGPALAVSIAVTVITALTLTPALMRLAGRWLFWPERFRAKLSTTDPDQVPLVVRQAHQLGLAADQDVAEPGRGPAPVAARAGTTEVGS
jgi:putative drug exporter of the RND superfamily